MKLSQYCLMQDMTCPNLQAAMLCISSKIDEMVAGQTEPSRWLENINSPVISLQQQLDVMCSRARCGLTYGMLKVLIYCNLL